MDADRRGQSYSQRDYKNIRLNSIRAEEKESVGISVAEEQEQENLPRMDPKDTTHMKLYYNVLNFQSLLSSGYGLEFSFQFDYRKHKLFISIVLLLATSFISIVYTQYLHLGDYVRMLVN